MKDEQEHEDMGNERMCFFQYLVQVVTLLERRCHANRGMKIGRRELLGASRHCFEALCKQKQRD